MHSNRKIEENRLIETISEILKEEGRVSDTGVCSWPCAGSYLDFTLSNQQRDNIKRH